MASSPQPARPLPSIVEEVAVYPEEAYDFVQMGLQFTVEQIHRETPEGEMMHVTGQQLSLGMRDYAWQRWGMMSRVVLQRWNVTSTMDFGKIVYALIEAGVFSRTDSDRPEDFRNVFEFRTFETSYSIPADPIAVSVPCPTR